MDHDFVFKYQPKSLKDYWAGALRRRWWILTPIFLVWALALVGSWFVPAKYRSETLILVEPPKVPEHYIVPNITSDLQERLQGMAEEILSRTRLARVIQEAGLYPELRNRVSEADLVDRMRKDIKVELVQAPQRQQDVTAFKIYYSASSPKLAQKIAGELTRLFIDENLRVRQEQSQSTTEFLQSELNTARQKLSEQEARVRDFKSQFLGELPVQLQPNLQIMSGLQTQLQGELDALNRAKQQNLYLKSLLNQYKSIQSELRQGSSPALVPPAIENELNRLKAELNDLNSRYTEQHPDVRKLKEQIANAEEMKRRMTKEIAAGALAGSTLDTNDPRSMATTADLESQLKANELEINNRQGQIAKVTGEIGAYQSRLNRIPIREQQMADLTRDYETSRSNYESLLAKKNQSELATNLQKKQQNEQFRILDPPSFPQKPYWPNRLKLSFFAILAGILIGVGCGVGLEVMDGSVRSESEIRELLPVAALCTTIPPLRTPDEERIRRIRQLKESAVAAVMLVVMLGGILLVVKRG